MLIRLIFGASLLCIGISGANATELDMPVNMLAMKEECFRLLQRDECSSHLRMADWRLLQYNESALAAKVAKEQGRTSDVVRHTDVAEQLGALARRELKIIEDKFPQVWAKR